MINRYYRLTWLVLASLPLTFCAMVGCHKTEDSVAVCRCALVGQASAKGRFGNYHSVRLSSEWLFEAVKGEPFKSLLLERCARDLESEDGHAISNAVTGISFEILCKSDDEWRFSITARANQKSTAVAVANSCADVMKEFLEAENRSRIEKSVSQMLAKKTKLERRLTDLNAEIKCLPDSSSDSAKALNGEVDKVQKELRLLASDELFVRSNSLAKCDALLILDRAE